MHHYLAKAGNGGRLPRTKNVLIVALTKTD